MPGLLDIVKGVDRFRVAMEDGIAEAKLNIAIEAVDYLTTVTQVDTSKAISNYRIANSVPENDDIEPYFPGEGGSTRELSKWEFDP